MSFIFININHDVGFESSESIPISSGYILAALKARGFDGIIVDDLRDRPLSLQALALWIKRVNARVIGFTAYQSVMNRIRFFCRFIKSQHPDILITLGGPQIPAMPPAGLEELEDVDVLVRGEGEFIMPSLAAALDKSRPLSEVPGIVFRTREGVVETDLIQRPPENLDEYPSPYLSGALDLTGKNTAILLSSRGCRHVCWFCITPKLSGGRIRYHSIGRVVAEMDALSKNGIERFWFADPNFTADRNRTEELLKAKIAAGITTPFWCQTRTDLLDPDLLQLMKEAGADTVAFGLESGSPGALERTNKGIELDQLRDNIAAAQALGIETELFTIFGLPGETPDDARQTLEFVRSVGIPITSNSGSQQMQLYFGSIYQRNPQGFGITPLPGYRPTFISVGDRFETSGMNSAEIRKIRNVWTLANERMEQDVYYKERIFEILDFLLENRADLEEEPAFHAFGALASCAIEEFDLVKEFVSGFARLTSDAVTNDLIESLGFFNESNGPIGSHDRVIFDSRSRIDGVPFTGISGKFWDVLLGRGLLLDEFEKGFAGARAGDEVQFSFTFPDDYSQEELRNKEVEVNAKIRKVFTIPRVETLEDVLGLSIKNTYNFSELDLLREQNEILYFLGLRDHDPGELLRTPAHFLTLIHRKAKLGKHEDIQKLAAFLEGKLTALNALADTLIAAGKPAWALPYYEGLSGIPSTSLKRVKCLLALNRADEALALIRSIPESQELDYQETFVQCLKAAEPDSHRIRPMEFRVMELRVKAALQKEVSSRRPPIPVIVHGDAPVAE